MNTSTMNTFIPRRPGVKGVRSNPGCRNAVLTKRLWNVAAWRGVFCLLLMAGCAVPTKPKTHTAYRATWLPASVVVVVGPVELPCFVHDETNLNFLDVTEAGAPVLAVSYLQCTVPDGPNKIDVQIKWPLDWPTWYSIWPPFDMEGPQTLSLALPTSLLPPPRYRVIKLP